MSLNNARQKRYIAVKRLWKTGHTTEEIAHTILRSPATVHRMKQQLGLTHRARGWKGAA